jgi:pimeloyl-ACP methyl ester carboxylesterase
VHLHADCFGRLQGARPVVCLPGLTRNARDFEHLARVLSNRPDAPPVVVLESRGRGRSDRAEASTYTLGQELEDLVAALDQWGVHEADLVGTSRGGLLAMLLAASAPERVRKVVLNDIGPTIEHEGLARIAGSVGNGMSWPSFDALAASLKAANRRQFPRLTADGWRRFAEQLASPSEDGTVSLDYDPRLAVMFEDFSHDGKAIDFWPAFEPLIDRDVLVVRGAHSDILSAATVEAMRRRHRRLQTLVIGDEGHAPLLWDRYSTDAIRTFLAH